jgi:DNA replication protein DnaD
MSNGWIKLHRDIMDHWVFSNPEYLQAWIGLLIMANHKTKTWLYNDNIVIIKRGEIVSSMTKLAGRWKWSRNKMRHFLGLLEKDEMIERKSNHNYTHLSICNYDTYQHIGTTEGTTEGQLKDYRRTTEGLQLKNVKNVKNVKNRESKNIQLKSIKDSFKNLQEKFPDADVTVEYDKFTDWMSATGKSYKDYKAAFRNWLRRSNGFLKKSDKVEFSKTSTGLFKAWCSKCGILLFFNKRPYANTPSECCGTDIHNSPVVSATARAVA